jgi:hypothetical protein
MNAHRIETRLERDGMLLLTGLPFQAGDSVNIIILECTESRTLRPPRRMNRTAQERADAFRNWATRHRQGADIPDEALHREAMYD